VILRILSRGQLRGDRPFLDELYFLIQALISVLILVFVVVDINFHAVSSAVKKLTSCQ